MPKRSKRWNSFFLAIFFLFGNIYPNDIQQKSLNKEIEKLKIENEDALMELSVKNLQTEIEKEKNEILEQTLSEPIYQNDYYLKIKEDRFFYNIILPGWGTYKYGEKQKGSLTIFLFSVFTISTYLNFTKTLGIRKELDRLLPFEYSETAILKNNYQESYLFTNLSLSATFLIYLYNLLESNSWNPKKIQEESNLSFQIYRYEDKNCSGVCTQTFIQYKFPF